MSNSYLAFHIKNFFVQHQGDVITVRNRETGNINTFFPDKDPDWLIDYTAIFEQEDNETEIKALENEIEDLEDTIGSLEDENTSLERELESLREETQRLEDSIDAYESDLRDAFDEIRELKRELHAYEDRREAMTE